MRVSQALWARPEGLGVAEQKAYRGWRGRRLPKLKKRGGYEALGAAVRAERGLQSKVTGGEPVPTVEEVSRAVRGEVAAPRRVKRAAVENGRPVALVREVRLRGA